MSLSNDEIVSTKFAVIGGGIAGMSCAEQLAIEEPNSRIILISASSVVKTIKNLNKISDRLEQFDVEEEKYTCIEDRHENCHVIAALAVKIDSKEKVIHLSNNMKIIYEVICICTGAMPKVISKDCPFVLGIRDTETVQVFQKKLSSARRVLIVGNGGIATELAYGIEYCQVVWAIKDKSVGSTFFDPGAAQFFIPCLSEVKNEEKQPFKRLRYSANDDSKEEAIVGSALGPDWSSKVNMKGTVQETRNVHVEYQCEVQKIYENEEFSKSDLKETIFQHKDSWPVYVQLTNGAVLGCDFIISATGVTPNTKYVLCDGLSLAEDGGIKVDDQMKTSIENVFAAGDVCSVSWPLSQHWFQMRLWTQARQMGCYAAKCMSCHLIGSSALLDICFDLFTHVTRFFGYKVILLGLFNGQKLGTDYEIIVRVSERTEYVKLVMCNGRMQGAILIGDTDLEETFENLILNQLDLTPYGEDILNPNIDIEDYFD